MGLYYAAPGTPAFPYAPVDAYRMVGNPVPVQDGGIFGGGTRMIPGIAPGNMASLQVRGWTASFATYEEAYNAALAGDPRSGLGHSIVMTFGLGGGTVPTPSLVSQGGLESFIIPLPEPSFWLLSLVAVAGLWAKRYGGRRRAS